MLLAKTKIFVEYSFIEPCHLKKVSRVSRDLYSVAQYTVNEQDGSSRSLNFLIA